MPSLVCYPKRNVYLFIHRVEKRRNKMKLVYALQTSSMLRNIFHTWREMWYAVSRQVRRNVLKPICRITECDHGERKCPWPRDSRTTRASQQMLVSRLSHLHFDTAALLAGFSTEQLKRLISEQLRQSTHIWSCFINGNLMNIWVHGDNGVTFYMQRGYAKLRNCLIT